MAVTINGTTGIVTPDIGVDGSTLVVDSANNRIGIGISSPGTPLDVAGIIQSDTGLQVAGHPVVGYATITGGYAARLGSTGSTTLNKTQIYARGANVATFDGATGNVGIGTDVPTGTLEINAAASTTDMIMLDVSGTNFAKIGHNSASGTAVLDIRSEGHTRFLTNGNNERLRITSDGNVAINLSSNVSGNATTTPWTNLHIVGANVADGVSSRTNSTPTGQLHVSSSGYGADQGGTISLGSEADNVNPNAAYASISGRRVSALGYQYGGYLTLNVSDGSNVNEKVRITSSGRIGVAKTNPAEQVDIIGTVRLSRTSTYTSHANISITHEGSWNYGSVYLDTSLDTAGFLFRTGGTTERLRITGLGGHRIKCNESWHAANLSECNTEKLALNINQTRQGQTKGIAIGCVGGGSGSTGIQAYDTSNNSANTLELNPFGGKLLYGDTASDLSGDHSSMFIGSKHAFQHDGNTGTYLSLTLGSADGTVDIEADARSGGYPDLTFTTHNDEQLRVLADGHIWKKNDGALWHGTTAIVDFSNAGRNTFNNVSIRAGQRDAGTTPTNSNSAIKIYPAGVRSTTSGNLTGGIAWQHLDPDNGSWDSNYGPGAQIWMGAALHDTPGQERDRFNLWMNSSTTGNTNPNNLAIEAYPNGMVRHPKVPAFMVRNTTNGNAFSANSKATWDTMILNNGSCFDNSNDRFIAPVDGIYHFTCQMLSNNNTRLFHELKVNGSRVDGTRTESYQGTSYQTNTFVATYYLSANDYAEVWMGSQNGYGGIYANFNGFLVG